MNDTRFSKKIQNGQILSSYVGYDPWFATNIPIIIRFWRRGMLLYLFLLDILQYWIADPMKSDKYTFQRHISDSFFILHPRKPKKGKRVISLQELTHILPI